MGEKQNEMQELKSLRLLAQFGACCYGATVDIWDHDPLHATVTVGPWDVTFQGVIMSVRSGNYYTPYPVDKIERVIIKRHTFDVQASDGTGRVYNY